MARQTYLTNNPRKVAAIRTVAGVIAADNSTLSDANYPVDETLGAVNCAGFQSIWVGVEIVAGTNPTATIEALVRDDDAADQSRWKRFALSATALTTGALATNQFAELRVDGHFVFLRITAVANATSTTGITILAMPGLVRGWMQNPYNLG